MALVLLYAPRMKRITASLGLLCLLTTLVGCRPSEAEAKAHLEKQGLAVTSIAKEGDGYRFTATKGKEICRGTLHMTKGMGSQTSNLMSSCERDTSACKAGAPQACVEIANELYEKDAKVFPETAAKLYRIACEDKKAEACARVAEFEAIGKNFSAVRDFAAKGCELGSGDACRRLALTERSGNGTPKDEAKAITLAKKACDLNSVAGCRDAAGMMIDATPSRAAEAIPLAEKACQAKFQDSCAALGIALFDAKKDYPTALSHLEPACAAADGDGGATSSGSTPGFFCNLAGAIVLEGLGGVKKDPARGMTLLERSCSQGFAAGCSNAGKMYRGGLNGVVKNKAKGDELFTKACSMGHQSACPKT